MTATVKSILEDDCRILLERALYGKFLCAFGEDGFGMHGRCDIAQWYKVISVIVEADADDPNHPTGTLHLTLEGYQSNTHGHIATDKNFDIALATHLRSATIDPATLAWPDDVSHQGSDCVVLNIDIPLLLDWA